MTTLQEMIYKVLHVHKDKSFISRIYAFIVLIKTLNLEKKDTIILSGSFNMNWLAAYLACLLSGRNLFIFPHKKSINNLAFHAHRHFSKLLLLDNEMISKMDRKKYYPFIDSIINYNTGKIERIKVSKRNQVVALDGLFDTTLKLEKEFVLDRIYDELIKQNKSYTPEVYTITSGRISSYYKTVVHTHETILDALYAIPEELDLVRRSKVSVETEYFEKFHVFAILNPFLKEADMYTYCEKADYVMHDTNSFMEWWHMNWSYIVSKPIFKILRLFEIFSFIQRFIDRKVLKKFVPENVEIFILGGNIPNRIMKAINTVTNFTTTFGDAETHYMLTYNQLGAKKKYTRNSVGVPFDGVSIHSNSTHSTQIKTSHLFKRYGEHSALNKFNNETYITKDLLKYKDKEVLYVGNERSKENGLNFDIIERELKMLPYIKNVAFLRSKQEIYLMIEPDVVMADLHNLGYIGLSKKFNDLIAEISIKYNVHIAKKAIIATNEKMRNVLTYDNQVSREMTDLR